MLNLDSKRLLVIIFIVSITVRLLLGFFNNGHANDDHLEVSNYILKNNALPKSLDCWQCYHPKLFHFTVAEIWKVFNIKTLKLKLITAQGLNTLLGIILLFLFWKIINGTKYSDTIKHTAFAFFALNPRLIAINSQASNDTFIIFFSSFLIYFCAKFYSRFSIKYLILLIVFSILAGLSKTSAFIVFFGILLILLIRIFVLFLATNRLFARYLYAFVTYIVIVTAGLYIFGDFKENKKNYGHYIVYNTKTFEVPDFFLKTSFSRPGIESIVSGYFTFRLFDLIENPKITTGIEPIPQHRTSLFSQLYGRANFIYFDNHVNNLNKNSPWSTNNKVILKLGSLAFIFALIPTLMLIIGIFSQLPYFIDFFKLKKLLIQFEDTRFINLIFGLGFMLFIFLFTALGRDFSFMKIIYLFPGMITMINPVLIGCNKIYSLIQSKKIAVSIFKIANIVLFAVYILPIIHLISIISGVWHLIKF